MFRGTVGSSHIGVAAPESSSGAVDAASSSLVYPCPCSLKFMGKSSFDRGGVESSSLVMNTFGIDNGGGKELWLLEFFPFFSAFFPRNFDIPNPNLHAPTTLVKNNWQRTT